MASHSLLDEHRWQAARRASVILSEAKDLLRE